MSLEIAKVADVVHSAIKLTGGKNHNLWICGTLTYLMILRGKYARDKSTFYKVIDFAINETDTLGVDSTDIQSLKI